MTTENPDTEAIEADSPLAPAETLTLTNGLVVKIQPLRMQGTLALLRIISRGAKDAITQYNWDPSSTDFNGQLVAAILFAIPEAPNETREFIQIMVQPSQLHDERQGKLTPGNQEWNDEQWELFADAMVDPDLNDLLDIVSAIIEREAPNFQALGKKIAAMIPMVSRTTSAVQKSSSDSTTPKKRSPRSSASSTPKASSARSRQRTT